MKKNSALQIVMCVAFGTITNCELQSLPSAQKELEIKNQIKKIGMIGETPEVGMAKKNPKPNIVASQKKKEIRAVSINTIEDFLKIFEDKEKYYENISIAAKSLQNPSNLKNMLGEICILPKYLNIDIDEVCNNFDDSLIVYYGERNKIPEFTTIEPFYAIDTSIFDLALALRAVKNRGSVVMKRLKGGSIKKLEKNRVDESFYVLAMTALIHALERHSTKVAVSGIFFRELAKYLYNFLNNTLGKENATELSPKAVLFYKLDLIRGEVFGWKDVSEKEKNKFVNEIRQTLSNIKHNKKMSFKDTDESVFGVSYQLVKQHFQKLKTELLNDINSKEYTELISLLPDMIKMEFEKKAEYLRDAINKIGNNSQNMFRLFLQIDTVLRAKSYFIKSLYEAQEKAEKGVKEEKVSDVKTKKKNPKRAKANVARKNDRRRKVN